MLVSRTIGFLTCGVSVWFPVLVGVHSQEGKRKFASQKEKEKEATKAFAAPELRCLECAPSGDKMGKKRAPRGD